MITGLLKLIRVDTGRFYNCLTTYYQTKADTIKFCRAAISLAVSTGNTKYHSIGLQSLAWVEWTLGDYSAAQVHAKAAQRLAIISADVYREAQALRIEATCCYTLGNYIKAMSLCLRARDLLGLCGMSHGHLDHDIMTVQAEVYRHKSEYVQAHSIHTRILEGTTIQDPYSYGYALLNVAEIDVLIGAPKNDVQRNCDRARKMLDTEGNVEGVTMCDFILADLHLREENSLSAKAILERCIKLGLKLSQITTYCLERLGNTSYWGDLDGMSSWTTVFLVHSLKRKEKPGIYKALKFLGDVFISQNDEPTAISLFTVALEGFTQMDVHHSRAECMLRLGDISMGHGDLLKAVELWERARPLFECSSQAKQVQGIDERVANISKDVLEKYRNNLARLAELNAPAGTVEELEDDLSDIEELDKMDMGEENGLGLIVV
jgi:tetratricopeptide (TPR) repeat protein